MIRLMLLSILTPAMALSATANADSVQSPPAADTRNGRAVTFPDQASRVADSPFGPAEQQNWVAHVDWGSFLRVTDDEGQLVRLATRPLVGHTVEVNVLGVGPLLLRVTGLTELVDGVSTVSGVLALTSQVSASYFNGCL